MKKASFMRLLLLYDLPMKDNKHIRLYNKFRKVLQRYGYQMVQFSVYQKLFNNREAAENHILTLRKFCPYKGKINLLMLTEKQFANMKTILGEIKIDRFDIDTTKAFVLI